MTDSIAVMPPGWRATDDSGNVVPGARLYAYESGSDTALGLYADAGLSLSLGAVIVCDAAGYPTTDGASRTLLYTGTAAYRLVLTDSDGVGIWTHDAVRAASVTPSALDTATPAYTVTVVTEAYSIGEDDRGAVFHCVCTGGTFGVQLPDASAVGAGWVCKILHDGADNQVLVTSVSGQSMAYRGSSRTIIALLSRGEAIECISNGSDWAITSASSSPLSDNPGPLNIADRTSTPPGSPVTGARYILTGSPTGAWSTFSEHDVVEADGDGGWLRYTPRVGWLAWVADETLYTAWDGSTWVDQTGMRRLTTVILPVAVFADQKASGTSGGNPTAAAWTTSTINTQISNSISGASLATNQITLPTGSYLVDFSRTFYATRRSKLRFRSVTDAAKTYYANQADASEDPSGGAGTYHRTSAVLNGSAVVTVTAATEAFDLQYYVEQTFTDGLGRAQTLGVVESYATVTIRALSATVTWP